MAVPRIEHVNVTVSDPDRAAGLMAELFGWQVRWRRRPGTAATPSMSDRTITISPSTPAATSPTPRTISPRAGRSTMSASRSTISTRPRPGSSPRA